MRAWAYLDRIALDSLQQVERPDPTPGPRDVVLRMRAVALNYRDIAIAGGNYHVGVAPPLVPVSDGCGEVVAAGAAVSRVKVGDLACPTYLPDWIDGAIGPRVAMRRLGGPSDGVLADLVCLSEDEVVKAPAHLSAEEAAALPVAAVTAWHSLYRHATLRPGEVLLVLGAGGISTAAVMFGRAGGARVIAATRGVKHAEAMKALGAHAVIDASAADWPLDLMRVTGGRLADVVVDVAGGPSLNRSILALRPAGHLHLVGYTADTQAGLDIFEAIRHAATIHVATAGHRESFEDMVRAMELHGLRPPIAARFPVEDFAGGLEALKAGGHFGKVVLTF
jgi:NADPH:quinone reductase-like Zn-dependent oxidoreductase